jgi:magnesium transporter
MDVPNEDSLVPVTSNASRRSNSASSAEDDACDSIPEQRRRDKLYIDFDYLETLMASEQPDCPIGRVFSNLRPESSVRTPMPWVTADGEFVAMPPGQASGEEGGNTAPKPGDPHGGNSDRFNFYSPAYESTLHAARFADLCPPGEDIRDLFGLPKGKPEGVWWLDVNNPTEDEARVICKAFGLHPLTIEDITTQEESEKIELFPSYYFACFRSFSPNGVEYAPLTIYVVVFREGTVSFSFSPNAHASQVRKRISMLKDHVSPSSDWICYALM